MTGAMAKRTRLMMCVEPKTEDEANFAIRCGFYGALAFALIYAFSSLLMYHWPQVFGGSQPAALFGSGLSALVLLLAFVVRNVQSLVVPSILLGWFLLETAARAYSHFNGEQQVNILGIILLLLTGMGLLGGITGRLFLKRQLARERAST